MTHTSKGASLIARVVNQAIDNGSPVIVERTVTRDRYQVKISSGDAALDRSNSPYFDTFAEARDYAARLLATYDDPDSIGILIYDWQEHRNWFAR